MKPLSKEELSKSAWEDFLNCQEVDDDAVNAYLCGYKRGYAKCIKQMQDEFDELMKACHTALQNQTNVDINEITNQMKGDTTDKERYFVGVDVGEGSDKTGFIKM